MNCPRCNTVLVADARFCGICGYAVPASSGSVPVADSSVRPQLNNEATQIGTQWADTQPAQVSAPPAQSSGFSQQAHGGPWAQQPPQAGWTPANQPPPAYPPGMVPGSMSSAGTLSAPTSVRRKRRGGCVRNVLLTFVLLVAVVVGGWFLVGRPYVHGLAQTQLDQALTAAQAQILLFQSVLPPGPQIIRADESSLNNYLSAHDTDQLRNLHATISPDGIRLDFTAYGFSNTVTAMLVASGGALQVTNVQEQGVLGLVMSSDELTTALNSHFGDIGREMHRTINAVTLRQAEIDIQIS
jgi:hypothetical protein